MDEEEKQLIEMILEARRTGKLAGMHWDCLKHGCFNIKKRLKFHKLDYLLPGNASFTDVDALMERKGNILAIEWKDSPGGLGEGQRIAYKAWTRHGPANIILVAGNAEFMTVDSVARIDDGVIGTWQTATLEDLQAMIRNWWDYANKGLYEKP